VRSLAEQELQKRENEARVKEAALKQQQEQTVQQLQ
jgi:hypothetical protein